MGRQIHAVLDSEVAVHRALLRLARARHLLLRQGLIGEADDLVRLETAHIMLLRDLEDRRRRLAGAAPAAARVMDRTRRWIAVLVRSLGAVERANHALRVAAPAGWSRLPVTSRTSAGVAH